MPESKSDGSERRRLASTLLVISVPVLMLAGLFVVFIPIVSCPDCQDRPAAYQLRNGSIHEAAKLEVVGPWLTGKDQNGKVIRVAMSDVLALLSCERCKRRGKVTLLRRMLGSSASGR